MINLSSKNTILLLLLLMLSACSNTSGTQGENKHTNLLEEESHSLSEVQQDFGFLLEDEQSDKSIEYLRISSHMVECEGFTVSHCFLAKSEGDEDWFYLYENIEGLDYKWGTEYELLVEVSQLNTPIADAPQKTYFLIEVIDSEQHAAGNSFLYTARNNHERIVEIEPGMFSLLQGKQFTCDSAGCDAIRAAIAQEHSTLLSFEHSEESDSPLVLRSVMCSESAMAFNSSCL